MKTQNKYYLILGSLLFALTVIFGAFGAHGLAKVLPPLLLKTYQTGVTYQAYHSIAILISAIIALHFNISLKSCVLWFSLGILLFSGGCYFYALSEIKFFAMVVPFGGVSFIIGWISLAVILWKKV